MTDDYIDPALREALEERLKGAPGGGEKLKRYWTEGEGAAKIRWGTPGDFDRCVRHLSKYIADPQGYCSDMHKRATGFRPGHAPSEQREETDMTEARADHVYHYKHGWIPLSGTSLSGILGGADAAKDIVKRPKDHHDFSGMSDAELDAAIARSEKSTSEAVKKVLEALRREKKRRQVTHLPTSTRAETEPVDVQQHIEVRATTTEVADVNVRQRLITVIAVPYEQPARIGYRGEMWDEMFARGSFDGIEKRPQRIRVNREHLRGDTVGKAIAFHPSRQEGLVSEIRIAKTVRGDDTLALAEDDCLSSSIGFGVRPSDQVLDRKLMQRHIKKAWLDHIALVESPAYTGADVLDVRDAGPWSDPRVPVATPVLDDFLTDPFIRRALGLE